MEPDEKSDTTFSGSTTVIGKALLDAPVMRSWPPTLEEARAILAGQPYEVLERIGHGGMGAVFKVRNLEPGMGRFEAVKIRRPEARDDDLFRERFLREIGTLAQLRHPGITTVFRSGDSSEGYLWFSMEFLEGRSLAEVLAPGLPPLSPERVLDITRQLCITLQFIHQAGRLHRDLKPANVMVCDDDSVRLLDFGIARPAESSPVSILTRPGDNPHTPDYASPEQKTGGPVDERADLYGLGRIVTDMIGPTHGVTRDRHMRFPQRLLDLADDLLAYDRDDRPNSAADVIEKLGQLEPGSPGFWGKDRCPFRGLEAYQPEHAEIFFGRDAAIRRGVEILQSSQDSAWNGFCLIIGGSGSGKSSLARAGLGPALLRGDDSPESQHNYPPPIVFDLSTVRSDDECLLPPLARAMAGTNLESDTLAIAAALRQSGADLTMLLNIESVSPPLVRLCLILDQFEHFFRASLPRNAQTRFLKAIARLARMPGIAVLVTLRSDFYHHCGTHPVFMQLKEGHQLDLAPPQPWELAAMLHLSARASSLRFETLSDGRSLDDILLDHARLNPQTLPLLSYMLDQLWERRDKEHGLLRVSDYENLGGFEGSVAAKATDTFERFSEDYPANPDTCLDRLFQLVVEMSDSSSSPALVRRLATSDELASTVPEVRRLAERFVTARLFVTTEEGNVSNNGLTLAHECLLRVWPRAIAWAENNRDLLRTRTRIAARMKEGSPLLAGDPLLESALEHLTLHPDAFTPEQSGYVSNAIALAREQARRRTRRRRLAFSGLSILAVFSLIGGAIAWRMKIVAVKQRSFAEEQRALADTQSAKVVQQRDQQEAMLWTASRADHEAALRAFDANSHAAGLAYLDRSLKYRPMNTAALAASANQAFGINSSMWRTRFVTVLEDKVCCVSFSPDSRYLAAGTAWREAGISKVARGKAVVFETATGNLINATELIGPVVSVTFSPDSRCLAIGTGSDYPGDAKIEARVIEAATGKEISKKVFDERVHSVSFSPDSRFFEGMRQDNKPFVTEITSMRAISNLALDNLGNDTKVHHNARITFSPDGRYLAVGNGGSGNVENTERIIELATSTEIRKFVFPCEATSVRFSPDNRFLAVGCWDNTTRVMEVATGKQISETILDVSLTSIIFSPDGLSFAGSSSDLIFVIEAATGRLITKTMAGGCVYSMGFSPDCRFLAVASQRSLAVIEAATGRVISELRLVYPGKSVAFSPDGRFLAVGGDDRIVRVMEVTVGNGIGIPRLGEAITSICFSPDGRYLAAGVFRDDLRVIELASCREISRVKYNVSTGSVVDMSMSYSPDGRNLAVAIAARPAEVIDVASGKRISKLTLSDDERSVSFSPDGRYLAVGTAGAAELSNSFTAWVIDAATGKQVSKLKFGNRVSSVRFSHDGQYLAAGSYDKTARVIEAATGREISKVIFDDWVNTVDISPDGRYVAAGSGLEDVGGEARIYEAMTGKGISKSLFNSQVKSVSFSRDGRFFAVGCWDNTMGVIDTLTGEEIDRVKFDKPVNTVSFSPDSHYLAASSGNRVTVFDYAWFRAGDPKTSSVWNAALIIASGLQFSPSGQLVPVSASELVASQDLVQEFLTRKPDSNNLWQHAILKWSRTLPEERKTSPWSDEPIRVAVGYSVMQTQIGIRYNPYADQAPWHPLSPVFLALTTSPAMPINSEYLAKLTLKRLRDADEKLYGRETLAEYAAWAAKNMHERLHLDPEALEALAFAIERTPEDKRQPLLDLRAKWFPSE